MLPLLVAVPACCPACVAPAAQLPWCAADASAGIAQLVLPGTRGGACSCAAALVTQKLPSKAACSSNARLPLISSAGGDPRRPGSCGTGPYCQQVSGAAGLAARTGSQGWGSTHADLAVVALVAGAKGLGAAPTCAVAVTPRFDPQATHAVLAGWETHAVLAAPPGAGLPVKTRARRRSPSGRPMCRRRSRCAAGLRSKLGGSRSCRTSVHARHELGVAGGSPAAPAARSVLACPSCCFVEPPVWAKLAKVAGHGEGVPRQAGWEQGRAAQHALWVNAPRFLLASNLLLLVPIAVQGEEGAQVSTPPILLLVLISCPFGFRSPAFASNHSPRRRRG